jgi:hypothetical protein
MLVLLLLAASSRVSALDRERSIGEFFHTAWIISEGAPSGLTQIAQPRTDICGWERKPV